jgi:hypothetical protein
MTVYSIALFIHLSALVLAAAATAVSVYAAWRLRAAETAGEVAAWGRTIHNTAKSFPVATLGLLGSGAYMVQQSWSWSMPWIVAALVGLAAMVVLGAGIEGGRGRVLAREVRTAGLSPRARRLLGDPVVWSARLANVLLMVAVMFVMTTKPGALDSAAALILAVVIGVLGALPLSRTPLAADVEDEAVTTAG